MFGHRYFGARYFGPRYWGPAVDAVVVVADEANTGAWYPEEWHKFQKRYEDEKERRTKAFDHALRTVLDPKPVPVVEPEPPKPVRIPRELADKLAEAVRFDPDADDDEVLIMLFAEIARHADL
jgi:hypothetical protein